MYTDLRRVIIYYADINSSKTVNILVQVLKSDQREFCISKLYVILFEVATKKA